MWGCLRRHRRKIFIVGGIVGGFVLLNSYLKKKFLEWEAKRTAEICEQLKKSSHFEGTMTTCDAAMISFVPKIKEMVCSAVDVNPIVDQLKQNPPNKMQLWEQLKVMVFTQALGDMYAQCLLAVLLKVQMSILGGYVFSNARNTNSPEYAVISEQQQKYMSHIAEFLGNGILNLLVPVEKAVETVLKSLPLNKPLKLNDIADVVSSIRNHISEGNDCVLPDIACYLIPTSANGYSNDEFLGKISTETRDILECQDFNKVLSASIDRGVNSLMDKFSECFGFLGDAKGDFSNPHDFAVPLAKIIPMMHNVFNQHQPTEPGALVHVLLQEESLKSFSANIYEAFSQINI